MFTLHFNFEQCPINKTQSHQYQERRHILHHIYTSYIPLLLMYQPLRDYFSLHFQHCCCGNNQHMLQYMEHIYQKNIHIVSLQKSVLIDL